MLKAPIVPPFLGLPSMLFAFLMAFMASTAWQNISLARVALVNEHTALSRLLAVPLAPTGAKQEMQSELRRYLTAVLEEEWAIRHNESASAAADDALESLASGIWQLSGRCRSDGRPADCSSDLVVSNYLKALEDLRIARDQRLSLANEGTLRLRWILAIILALATALSIAAVHRTNPRASMICLAIYGVSIWMTFAMVALHIQPYRGPDALSPQVLTRLLANL